MVPAVKMTNPVASAPILNAIPNFINAAGFEKWFFDENNGIGRLSRSFTSLLAGAPERKMLLGSGLEQTGMKIETAAPIPIALAWMGCSP